MDYVTVFDAGRVNILWMVPIVIGIFVVVGLVLLVFRGRLFRSRFAVITFPLAVIVTGVSIGTLAVNEHAARRELAAGGFKVVAGEVRNFHPMMNKSDREESFEVDGVPFRYTGHEMSAGFNMTVMRDGPIREGLPVRITYHDGVILRLEIRADHVRR